MTSYRLEVFYEDTDAGGIVYHANYLKFAERARGDFMHKRGLSNQALAKDKMAFVVKKISIEYHAPAVLEDHLLIETTLVSCHAASALFHQEFFREDDTSKKCLVSLDITVALINTETKRPTRIPAFLLNTIQSDIKG